MLKCLFQKFPFPHASSLIRISRKKEEVPYEKMSWVNFCLVVLPESLQIWQTWQSPSSLRIDRSSNSSVLSRIRIPALCSTISATVMLRQQFGSGCMIPPENSRERNLCFGTPRLRAQRCYGFSYGFFGTFSLPGCLLSRASGGSLNMAVGHIPGHQVTSLPSYWFQDVLEGHWH